MTNEINKSILQRISQSLEIDLEFDELGQCFLLLDERLMVSIRSLNDAWVFYGMVGNINGDDEEEDDDDESGEITQMLLSRNLKLAESGAGVITLEESSGVIMLVLRVPTIGINGDRMQEILGNFVDQLSNEISALNGEQPEKAPTLPDSYRESVFFERA